MEGRVVLGIKYDTGVIVAADTLVNNSSYARFQHIERVFKINDRILLSGAGTFADVQCTVSGLKEKAIADSLENFTTTPRAMATFMTNILGTPRFGEKKLEMSIILAGMNEDDKPFLCQVDTKGNNLEDFVLATGFANMFCVPFVCESKPKDRDFTSIEAIKVMRDSMRLLFYRHTHSLPIYTVGVCNKFGCRVKGPFKVEENWDLAIASVGF